NSESYKEYYAIASGKVPPKTKASVHKKKADFDTTPKEKPSTDPKDKRVKQTSKITGSGKQNSQASGSGDGVDILSKVPDEQVHEKTGTDKGACDKPEVPDVPEHHSNSEEESWNFSEGDDDDKEDDDKEYDDEEDDDDEDDDANKDSDAHDDDDLTESDDDGDNITHLKLSTFLTEDQEENNDEEEQEEDEEEISDQLVRTPSDYQTSDESEKQKDDDRVKNGEEDKEGDVTNVALEGGDVDMTEADTTKDTEDAHVTLTAATPVVQQQSSSVSDLVSKFISPTKDEETYQGLMLIRYTNQPQTSYGIASSLSELELKRILMDKMEENKSIDRSDVQKNLYNALVEAYNTDKDLLSSYDDVMIFPTTRDDKDKDDEPSAGSN
ncbi:hypothetical protein Tco_0013540, partial [Tanacetum coccineum]